MNIISLNSFFVIITRSFISALLTFGIFFGVYYVLNDILKIDLTSTEKSSDADDETKNKVDLTVGDDLSENKEDNLEEEKFDFAENEFNDSESHEKPENVEMESAENVDSTENQDEDSVKEDMNFDTGIDYNSTMDNIKSLDDTEETVESDEVDVMPGKNNTYNKGDSVKDKLGMDASPEDLVKAIRTKMQRDE
jgi:hypothetical protein